MGMPSAPHLNIAGEIRKAVDVPIFHAGGIADIATAKHAISEGHVDLVGMTRAQIADPYLVTKLTRDQEDRIRPCVGLGYCVDRVNQGKQAVCGHNAATGREATMPHVLGKSATRKKAIIIGGGVGGLEAARICAERGHKVVLYEASDRLGGQLNLASKSTTRKQLWGVADWLINEVTRLGVELHLNRYIEADDILAEKADLVIVATGGWPQRLDIEGQDLLVSTWDVLSGETNVTGEVLLFDEVGDHAAAVCCEVMAKAGCDVKFTSPDRGVLQELGPTNSAVVIRALAKLEVKFECFYDLISVAKFGNRKRVTLRHVLTGALTEKTVDTVVVENGIKPMEKIYLDLKQYSINQGELDQPAMTEGHSPFVKENTSGNFLLIRLGDAIAGRNIHAALYDALRLCKDF